MYFVSNTTGLGQPSTYLWNFGDGTISTAPPRDHICPGPATYTSCLTVTTVFEDNGTLINRTDAHSNNAVVGGGNPIDGLTAGSL